MSKNILNIDYREILDVVDSYEEYLSSMSITLDAQLWKKTLSVDNKRAYQEYLNKYPKGHYYDKAQSKINAFNAVEEREKETKAWNKALNKNTKASYEKYLMNYYNGLHNNEATRKVDEFIRVEKEKELEEQRVRDIELTKEQVRLEKIEQEKKLALDKRGSDNQIVQVHYVGLFFGILFLFLWFSDKKSIDLFDIKLFLIGLIIIFFVGFSITTILLLLDKEELSFDKYFSMGIFGFPVLIIVNIFYSKICFYSFVPAFCVYSIIPSIFYFSYALKE